LNKEFNCLSVFFRFLFSKPRSTSYEKTLVPSAFCLISPLFSGSKFQSLPFQPTQPNPHPNCAIPILEFSKAPTIASMGAKDPNIDWSYRSGKKSNRESQAVFLYLSSRYCTDKLKQTSAVSPALQRLHHLSYHHRRLQVDLQPVPKPEKQQILTAELDPIRRRVLVKIKLAVSSDLAPPPAF